MRCVVEDSRCPQQSRKVPSARQMQALPTAPHSTRSRAPPVGYARLRPGGDLAVSGSLPLALGGSSGRGAVGGAGAVLPASLLTDALLFKRREQPL